MMKPLESHQKEHLNHLAKIDIDKNCFESKKLNYEVSLITDLNTAGGTGHHLVIQVLNVALSYVN